MAVLVLSATLERSVAGIPARLPLGLAVLGMGFMVLVLLGPTTAARRNGPESRLLQGFLAVPVVAILLAMVRGNFGDSLPYLGAFIGLLAIARVHARHRVLATLTVMHGLLAVSIALALLLPQFVLPAARGSWIGLEGRAFGLLQAPNVMGQVAAFATVATAVYLRGRRRQILVVLGAFGLLTTASQTAAAALVAGLLLVLLQSSWGRRHKWGVGAVTWFGVTAIFVELVVNPQWFSLGLSEEGVDPGVVTLSARTEIWSFLLSQEIPVIGLGQTRIAEIFAGTRIDGAAGVSSAHNAFVDAFVRDGYLGSAAIAFLVYAIIIWVRSEAGRRSAPIALVMVIESMTEVTPTHLPLICLYFACLTGRSRNAEKEESGSEEALSLGKT